MKWLFIIACISISYNFRVIKDCSSLQQYIKAYENILIYDNSTESLANKFIDECAPHADKYALFVLCDAHFIPSFQNLTSDVMPIYIKKHNDQPHIYQSANCSFVKTYERLSILAEMPKSNRLSTPYINVILNATMNGTIYDEFAEIAKMGILKFKGYYYTDAEEGTRPQFKIIDGNKQRQYFLDEINPNDMAKILKGFLNEQAKAKSATLIEESNDYRIGMWVVTVLLWTAFLLLFTCKNPFTN